MRKITATLVVAATAVLATGAGLGTASASPAAAAKTGTEHFYLMSTSTTSNNSGLIATGVFTAAGVDVGGNSTDLARLPGGTFKIHHPGDSGGSTKVNPTTCFATYTDTTKITLGNGTGKYKGIGGSGTAVVSVVAILPRVKGHCSQNADAVASHETIIATAKVHL